MTASVFRLGVIGDLHTHWDEVDVVQFNNSGYDLLYFIGDLGGGTPESTLRVAREMSRLKIPALVMPGNNDTVDIAELAAELRHRSGLNRLQALRNGTGNALEGNLQLAAYQAHRLTGAAADITLISGRPHSMGGPELSFAQHLQRSYDVADMQASTDRLCALVETVETGTILFLAHNGPTGLGAEDADMWGCDFKPGGGDWGDSDFRIAIEHAKSLGKRVPAVIAGHMHLRTKSGTERTWRTDVDGTSYVNSARVPRIFAGSDDVYRHHVCVTISASDISIEEVLVPQYSG